MTITEVNPNDPRVVRTRQLIIDAFVDLLGKKDFYSITVSDISKQATINRATFYAHFTDKFALIDRFLSASFIEFAHKRVNQYSELTEETIQSIVITLCEYHEISQKLCRRNYEAIAPHVEKNIKVELEHMILQIMIKDCKDTDEDTLRLAANILTWSIYGVTYRWNIEKRSETPQQFAEKILPILRGGFLD